MTTIQHRVQNVTFIPITVVFLIIAVALPVIVHLIPSMAQGAPNGARLLPMYIAPLLLVIWKRPAVAVVVAGLAPLVNALLTGMPASALLPSLTLELMLFTGVAVALYRWKPKVAIHALVAVVVSRAIVLLLTGSVAGLFASLTVALPGIILLTIINIALVYYER